MSSTRVIPLVRPGNSLDNKKGNQWDNKMGMEVAILIAWQVAYLGIRVGEADNPGPLFLNVLASSLVLSIVLFALLGMQESE
eukprot:436494-Karenia_brevis.AAC.1